MQHRSVRPLTACGDALAKAVHGGAAGRPGCDFQILLLVDEARAGCVPDGLAAVLVTRADDLKAEGVVLLLVDILVGLLGIPRLCIQAPRLAGPSTVNQTGTREALQRLTGQ